MSDSVNTSLVMDVHALIQLLQDQATGQSGGGIVPTGTIEINQNGEYDVTEYAAAAVNVPNTYGESDEGKVVSSGALVSQTAQEYTSNGVYDTTLIDEVTVNVSGYTLAEIAGNTKPTGTVDLTGIVTGAYGLAGKPMTRVEGTLDPASNIARLFIGCTNLQTACILFNNKPTGGGGSGIFEDCSNLETAVLICDPTQTNDQQGMFQLCSKLKTADLNMSRIHNNCFYNDSSLDTLILRRSDAIMGLSQSIGLGSTKFKSGGAGGTIYIPEALYNHLGDNSALDYKAATNWSVYEGYGTIT